MNNECCQHEVYGEPGSGSPLKVGLRENYPELGQNPVFLRDAEGGVNALQEPEHRPILLYTRVDTRPPSSASSGCVSATAVRVTVTDEAGGSGPAAVRYTIDGGAEQTAATDGSGNADIAVPSGQHTVTFRGVDKAGNVEANANSVTVTCSTPVQAAAPDRSRPSVSVAGVRSSCVRRAFRIRLTARDGGSLRRVVAKRDGRHLVNRAFSATTRTSFTVLVKVAGLRAGRHTIAVAARDTAGNRTTVNRTFRVCAAQRRPAPAFTG